MPVPTKPPITEIKIVLEYTHGLGFVSKEFRDVWELADFLKDNPPIAEAVGYVPKPKR